MASQVDSCKNIPPVQQSLEKKSESVHIQDYDIGGLFFFAKKPGAQNKRPGFPKIIFLLLLYQLACFPMICFYKIYTRRKC